MASSEQLHIQHQTAMNRLAAGAQQSAIIQGVIEGTWDPSWLHCVNLSPALTAKVVELVPFTQEVTE